MPEVTIVTDSTACLTRELADKYRVKVVPLSFLLQGKVYRDWVDITPSEAYALFQQDPDSFESSAPTPVDFITAFREAAGLTPNILCITISGKLSTTPNVAKVAAEQVIAEKPGIKITVMDSKTVTAAEGLIAVAAARAAGEGKNFAEVIQRAEAVRYQVAFIQLLDTIEHVYRSGRIPKIASQVGAMLHVKPILSITPETDGAVKFIGIERSHANGVRRLIKLIKEMVGDSPIRAAVMHVYAPAEAEKFRDIVAAEFRCNELWLTEFSPLMGYAVGTGTIGLAFYKET